VSDGIPGVNARPLVLIGPVCAGKSVAGTLVAERLGHEFIEADWVSSQIYAERGWSPARFANLKARRGAEAAYDDFEAFAAARARQALYAYPGEVIAMGAGDTPLPQPAAIRGCARHLRCGAGDRGVAAALRRSSGRGTAAAPASGP
jgi:hypothetical protein